MAASATIYLYGGRIAAGQFDGTRDTFVFSTANWGRDLILDWEDGIDRLDISGTGLSLGDFTLVDSPQGVRLDWFNAAEGRTMAIHLFGQDQQGNNLAPDDISAADVV